MERLNLKTVAFEVQTIKEKVAAMEQLAKQETHNIKMRLDGIETTSGEILAAVKTAKTVSRFARRWAGPVIASAATAGFFNQKFTAFLTALIS